jgi:hypothetical protein
MVYLPHNTEVPDLLVLAQVPGPGQMPVFVRLP